MKITKKLKILGEVVALSLVFALCPPPLPHMSEPVWAEDGSNVIIYSEDGHVIVSPDDHDPITISGNKGTASCSMSNDGKESTIELDNFELDPSVSGNYPCLIFADTENLEIVYSGTNSLDSPFPYGILCTGNIRFRSEDNGTLTIKTSGSMLANSDVVSPTGILALRGITVESGNITVTSGNSEGFSAGIGCADGLTMTGGSLNCSAGSSETNSSYGYTGIGISGETGYEVIDAPVTIGENVGSFVSSGKTSAVKGTVKNSIPGTGWTDPDGTEGRTEIAVNTTGTSLDFKKVQFPTAPKDKTKQSLSFNKASLSLKVGEKGKNELTGNKTTVTYKSGDTSIATVDSVTGEVTGVAKGETVITATASENSTYEKGEASYTVTVTEEGDHQHTLVKHDRVEATEDKEGNIEYWSCEGCGKYFKDADGKEEIELKDTVIPKKPHEITPFENKAMDVKSETIDGGYQVTYAHQIPFPGKGKLTAESFGDNFTVLQGNATYKVKKIKVNKKKHRIQILKLENAPKDVEKAVKKATKGDKGIPYTQNPYYVKDTDKLTPKFKKSGAAASVKVNINGKDYKAKKTEYEYNEASKIFKFKGDNLAGSWAVK